LKEPAAATSGRQNFEITALFREGCNEDNRLGFDALRRISDIRDMLQDGDLSGEELEEMWEELPQKGGTIDVLAFRDFLKQLDELFEYSDDDEDVSLVETGESSAAKVRPCEMIKREFLEKIDECVASEDQACGLAGKDENDVPIVALGKELEASWRTKVGRWKDWEVEQICGDWELVYSTSTKFRRWQSISNVGAEGALDTKPIRDAALQEAIINFNVEEDGLNSEYDMEETFLTGDTQQELGVRQTGTWQVAAVPNVISGDEDMVLRLNLQGVEYDSREGVIEKPKGLWAREGQMVKVFSYCFIAYQDEDMRVLRSDMTGQYMFVYRRLDDE